MKLPAPDKTLHFAAGTLSAAAGAMTAALAQHLGYQAPPGLCSLGASVAAALAREAYNVRTGGRWSWGDISATVLGGSFVAIPVQLT
jgi:uncharacterized protein YfiM (DUF2279 family)